jgi:DNA (cytosine-5)-methyltransferase 1
MMMLKEKADNREEWAGMAYRGGRKEKFWPTPNASDVTKWSHQSLSERLEKGQQVRLNTAVAPAGGQGGSLNPTWVEWLMGFPEGWTDLKPSETPSSRRSPK